MRRTAPLCLSTLRALLVFFLFLGYFYIIPVAKAEDTSPEKNIIRVGMISSDIDHPRLKETEPLLIEYIKSYLNELSKQNDWRYEYYYGNASDCYTKLTRGELDLIAPVRNTPSDYPDLIYTQRFPAYTLLNIYKLKSRDDVERENFKNLNNFRIGITYNDNDLFDLNYYIRTENLTNTTILYYDTADGMLNALRSGEVDAVLDDCIHMNSQEFAFVDSVNVSLAHFATRSDKQDLVDALNDEVAANKISNYSFESHLENQYITPVLNKLIFLTVDDQHFIDDGMPVRVLMPTGIPGWLNEDDDGYHGFYYDYLQLLGQRLGLNFDIVPLEYNSNNKISELLNSDQADIMLGIYDNERPNLYGKFTNDFFNENYLMIQRKNDDLATVKHIPNIAVPDIVPNLLATMTDKYPDAKIVTVSGIEEAIRSVRNETADFALIPEIYAKKTRLFQTDTNITYDSNKTIRIPMGFFISTNTDQRLLHILNTGMLFVDTSEILEIKLRAEKPEETIFTLIAGNPDAALKISIMILVFLLLSVSAYLYLRFHRRELLLKRENKDKLDRTMGDLVRLRRSASNYKSMSEKDPMTGLLNKESFTEYVTKSLRNKPDIGHTLFIIDLDHFKAVNDTYGHKAGDDVIKNFAEALKTIFRDADFVGRFGGDEFIVCIPYGDAGVLRQKASYINTIARKITVEGYPDLKLSASVGIAVFPEHGQNFHDLFQAADQALYHTKETGRDGYTIYNTPYKKTKRL